MPSFILLRPAEYPHELIPLHIPAPDDDTSTLCGEPTDEMEAVEIDPAKDAVVACAACMTVAVG